MTPMRAEEIELENRRVLYRYIRDNPGTHLRKIERDIGMNIGTLRHHVEFLEKKRIIVSSKDGNLKVFFAAGELSSDEKRISPILQQKRLRNILLILLISPGVTHGGIAQRLSMKPSTLSKYLRILENKEIIEVRREQNEKHYSIRDEKEIIELLLTYRKSFWDSFVDNMLEIYFEQG